MVRTLQRLTITTLTALAIVGLPVFSGTASALESDHEGTETSGLVEVSWSGLTEAPAPADETVDVEPTAPAGDGDLVEVEAPIVIETGQGHNHELPAETVAEVEESLRSLDPLPEPVTLAGIPTANAVTSGMSLVFTNPTPRDVKLAVGAAVNQWNAVLKPVAGAPIVVQVSWESMNNTALLGAAGPETMWFEPAGTTNRDLPKADVLYPTALLNVLSGEDANGPARPEIVVALNKDRYTAGGWYTGTGRPGAGRVDLRSVVAHEIAHGLGFLASPQTGRPALGDTHFAYDTQIKHRGTAVTKLADETAALTSNRLRTRVSKTLTAKTYAPTTWRQGSSLSHIHPVGAQAGSLMTPSLNEQQVKRNPRAWVLGALSELGWPTWVKPVKPRLAARTTGTSLTAKWAYNLNQTALAPDTTTVEVTKNGKLIAKRTFPANKRSHTITGLEPNTSYTITVTTSAEGRHTSTKTTRTTGS